MIYLKFEPIIVNYSYRFYKCCYENEKTYIFHNPKILVTTTIVGCRVLWIYFYFMIKVNTLFAFFCQSFEFLHLWVMVTLCSRRPNIPNVVFFLPLRFNNNMWLFFTCIVWHFVYFLYQHCWNIEVSLGDGFNYYYKKVTCKHEWIGANLLFRMFGYDNLTFLF